MGAARSSRGYLCLRCTERRPSAGPTQGAEPSPTHAPSCLTTTYSYDSWGNREQVTLANCAAGGAPLATFEARTTLAMHVPHAVTVSGVSVNVPAGVFPVFLQDALNFPLNKRFDPRFGLVTVTTDVNSITTESEYDAFGRKVRDVHADGTRTLTLYCYLSGRVSNTASNPATCPTPAAAEIPADAVMFVHSEPRDSTGTEGVKSGAFTRSYVDRAARTIRVVTEAYDDAAQPGGTARLVVQDTDYNPQGLAIVATAPYFLDTGSSAAVGAAAYGMTLTQYDVLGRVTASFVADAQGSQTSVSFGTRGSRRAARTTTAWSALSSTVTDDLGRTRTEERNVDLKTVRVTDALGAQIVHQYDAFDNLVRTRDALQNVIALSYDIRGRKLSLEDPDAGVWGYCYDALGQLKAQQNATMRGSSTLQPCPLIALSGTTPIALAQWTTYAHDRLGRLRARLESEPAGNFTASSWTYDAYADTSACNRGIGRLCETSTSSQGNGLVRRMVYDNVGRLTNTRTSFTNGPAAASAVRWHPSNGRLVGFTYPTGLSVSYNHTAKGFLASLTLDQSATVNPLPTTPGGTAGAPLALAAGTTLWRAQAYDARGNVEQHTLSGGVSASRDLDALSGRLVSARATAGGTLLDQAYAWNSVGQLTARVDAGGASAVTEAFGHDALGRLIGHAVASTASTRRVSLDYNALGSLLYKSDLGVYTYPAQGSGSVRPHAVQGVSGGTSTSYGYDANGNATSASAGRWRSMAYTSFNLPGEQVGAAGAAGSPGYTWSYDPEHQRYRETRTIPGGAMAGTRTTWMLHPDNRGGLAFESEVNSPVLASPANPAATSNRHYLTAGGSTIGVLVTSGALPSLPFGQTAPPAVGSLVLVKTEYWHKDHLGSLAATSDHAGALTQRYAYEPFGKRRNSDGSADAADTLGADWSPAVNAGTDRGFTGHEQLDDIGLVHMNGRLYDPRIARFVQPDPEVTFPADLRSYDRYTYVLNDPLGMTDPSGLNSTYIDSVEAARMEQNRPKEPVDYKNESICGGRASCVAAQYGNGKITGDSTSNGEGSGGRRATGTQAAQSGGQREQGKATEGTVGNAWSEALKSVKLAVTNAAEGLADKVDDFQRTKLGHAVQGMLPGEAVAAGALKAGLLWASRIGKAEALAEEAAKGAVEGLGFARSQLQHGFKHAKDFGVGGNANNKTLSEFSSALQSHVDAAGTRAIQGTYRGNPVTHHVDPSTGLNVIRDSSGNFLSGWKLSPQQLQHVLTTGKLGGG